MCLCTYYRRAEKMIKKSLLVSLALIGIVSFQRVGISAESDSAVDKLIADYTSNANLASTLVNTANQYSWDRKYDEAEKLYRAVIDKHPNNPYAAKAQLGLARLDILNLIAEKKYSAAREQVNYMVSDFRNEPDCAVALFQIGQEFGWQRRYEEAKNAFDLIIETFPTSPVAQEVKLWSARANVCMLINGQKAPSTSSGQAKEDEIVAAIDKLISDYDGDSRLPDALFWISREYEWTRGTTENRIEWYNAPNSVYERLLSQFKYGQAEWDYKRLSHRMNIFKLIKEPNQSETDAAIEQMVKEFAGRPEIAGELYWIACGYEEQEKSNLAKQMYERIISEYPETVESVNAALDSRRLDIWETFKAGDVNTANILIDKFITDFNQHQYSGTCLGRIAIKYFLKGLEYKQQGQPEKATQDFEKSKEIWQKIIERLPESSYNAPDSLFALGFCCNQLNQTEEAKKYFKKLVETWPDYKFADEARLMGEYGLKDVQILDK